MRKIGLMAVVACVTLAGTAHAAFDWFGGRLSVGGGYGLAKPKLPYSFQDQYKEGRIWTVHGKYYVNDNLSVVASYADMMPERRDNAQTIQFRPIVGSVRYNIFKGLPISPYITGGAGVSRNRLERAGLPNVEWTKFTWQAGLGFEFFVNEGASIGAEALYHDFTAESHDVHHYRPASLVGTVNLYFGAGPQTKRAREDAKKAREEADRANQEASSARSQANTATQQTQTSQADADAARAQALAAQQAAAAAQQQAATATAGQEEANRKAQEAQAQMAQAQAEVDQIKQMVARKDISPVTFQTGSAILAASSAQTLDKVADVAKKYPNLKLRVEGHTDNVGSDTSNQKLSQKRADSVKTYLIGKGVSDSQVSSVGSGASHPIVANDSAEGKAQNRRVEFLFNIQ